LQQVTGTVDIKVPVELLPEEEALNDPKVMKKYENLIVSWTEKIQTALKHCKNQTKKDNKSMEEIESWRVKSAILMTSH
jgi:hypothetical protein